MTNKLNNLKQEAQKIRLSTAERASMRANIFGAPAPYTPARAKSPYVFFFTFQRAVAFALVLVVLVGSTSAYAAGGSVPGDLLYTVKVNVNEPLRGALAVSNQAKINFHTNVAEERLKEAETLASKGRLGKDETAQIEASFDLHIAEAASIAEELENEEPGSGEEASITLDSSIAAHGNILARIGSGSNDKATKENSRSLAERSWSGRGKGRGEDTVVLAAKAQTMSLAVTDNLEVGGAGDASVPVEVSTATSDSQKRVVAQLRVKAESTLGAAREGFDDARSSLAATTSIEVKTQLEDLEKRMAKGKEEYEAEEYGTAKESFTAVLEGSIELLAYIEASKKFKKDFIRVNWRGGNYSGGWSNNSWGSGWSSGDNEDDSDDDNDSEDEDDRDSRGDDDDHGVDLPLKIDL